LGGETIATSEETAPRRSTRVAAGIIGAFDAIAWLLLLVRYFRSDSNPTTANLDATVAWVTTILFAFTGAPALLLAIGGRAPRVALLLSLAFPTVFVALLVAVAYALA
jgi:hypothetical protein